MKLLRNPEIAEITIQCQIKQNPWRNEIIDKSQSMRNSENNCHGVSKWCFEKYCSCDKSSQLSAS